MGRGDKKNGREKVWKKSSPRAGMKEHVRRDKGRKTDEDKGETEGQRT